MTLTCDCTEPLGAQHHQLVLFLEEVWVFGNHSQRVIAEAEHVVNEFEERIEVSGIVWDERECSMHFFMNQRFRIEELKIFLKDIDRRVETLLKYARKPIHPVFKEDHVQVREILTCTCRFNLHVTIYFEELDKWIRRQENTSDPGSVQQEIRSN